MKVILIKDVGGVGKKDTIKEFADGYALNFLIAKGLAVQASPMKIAEIEARQKNDAASIAEREKEWGALAEKLSATNIVIPVRANESNHLYTQLSPSMIVAGIKQHMNIDVPPDAIVLNAPIKEIGTHNVIIKFGKKSASLTITVVRAAK